MWIARDSDNTLWAFKNKPKKEGYCWQVERGDYNYHCLANGNSNWLFPEVKWEDEEPRELILKPIK